MTINKGIVVDDDIDQLIGMKILLEKKGYLVETALSLEQASDKIARSSFSFGVVDLKLDKDKNSGLKVIDLLLAKQKSILIFCLSAYLDEIKDIKMPTNVLRISKPLLREKFELIFNRLDLHKRRE